MASFAELLDILYEDNHCLGLNKPAGWPTTHFNGTEETVDRLAKAYIKEKYGKPRQRLSRHRPSTRQTDERVAALRQNQQGREPAERAVP